MSEYQYYEFRAVDRALEAEEIRGLRAVSTRAAISPTSFVNTYDFGDFKGDPYAWVQRYFDAFLYLANWGTRELILRLPKRLLPAEAAGRYAADDFAVVSETDAHVLLSYHSDEDGGDDEWDDGSGWLPSILPVREEVAGGDHRALYLGWLLSVQDGEMDDDAPEPPVPPGLAALTPAQEAFRGFLRISPDLVAAAAEASAPLGPGDDDEEPLRRWIAALPEAERTDLLVRTARGEGAGVRAELVQRFRAGRGGPPSFGGRTVGDLLAAAERREDERRERALRRAAAAEEQRARERAAARAAYLDGLSAREERAWRRVDELIATRQPKRYDEAAALLADLLELAERDGRAADAEARIGALRAEHAKKPTLLKRLDGLARRG